MNRNIKDKARKKISTSEDELRMASIASDPEPIPVGEIKVMINGLLNLQQQIIRLADPEMTLLSVWVAVVLDDLREIAARQWRVSYHFAAILEEFARGKAKTGR